MPRNKVLERAKVTMPSGRNAVDLSCEKSFAQYAADLNVCYVQPVVAGTSGYISRKCFTRTADVVSPAFHRITKLSKINLLISSKRKKIKNITR